ncbi:V-type H+-transporting ATPase subunit E [Alteracholeplasma palmae J233]|uniref:V-type H+-transporting ATPase subunit E n=1 Tax=Alteracholeplasma palmae (strain ATCC 49389 / J233) TaxID=1318466 RepID=U4KQK4_ALTPJ|nr:hypothetical protein [Alteracholeplasma palmae]CCV64735.1 V-type H+-transporting ATPase subunit E [Alteracholeplasma palmae J233]
MNDRALHERIVIESKLKSLEIEKQTTQEIETLKHDALNKIKEEVKDTLKKFQEKSDLDILMFEKKKEAELNSFQKETKVIQVESLFDKVYEYITKLDKKELCNWVYKLVNVDEIFGDEIIYVSSQNMDKYLEAFSSKKDKDDLDLLNKKNKNFKFKLKTDNLNFKEGFIVVKDDFDLIFDYKQIVDEYKKNREKEVYEKFYGNE